MFFVFGSIPNQYKTQEMCSNSIISEGPLSIKYISDQNKTLKNVW